jgi:hypothetical protein
MKKDKFNEEEQFYGSEAYQRMLEWLVAIGWILAGVFASIVL